MKTLIQHPDMSATGLTTAVRSPRTFGLASKVVCLLAILIGGVVDAFAIQVQYRQGELPNAAYQHVGSEIRGNSPTANFGGSFLIRAGGQEPLRTVLGFPLQGIPGGATITSIQLEMHNADVDGAPLVDLHRLQHATHPMIEGAQLGGADDPVGVNWNRVQNNGATDILWATPGGDIDATPLGSVQVVSDNTWYTFASSPAFVAAANDALNNNAGLLELLIKGAPGLAGDQFARFDSDDTVGVGGSIAFRPILTVDYVPEPAGIVLLFVGGLGAALITLKRRSHLNGKTASSARESEQ